MTPSHHKLMLNVETDNLHEIMMDKVVPLVRRNIKLKQSNSQILLCSIIFERCQGFTLTFCLQSGHLKTSFENFKLHVAQ
jgi:hypothetical protein